MSGAQKRIAVAVILAATLISVALFLRENQPDPESTEPVVAVVSTTPARKAIPEQDLNGDGIPDWQNALQITEPLTLAGAPDENYTNPDTLTEQFALGFFEEMIRSKNYGDFGDSPDELAASAANSLTAKAQDTLLTKADITQSTDSSVAALESYGEAIAQVLVQSPKSSPDNEAAILQRAIRNNNPDDLQLLDTKISAYEYLLAHTLEIPTPPVAVTDQVALVNSYKAILEDIKSMQQAFDDPMYTLLRLKRYQDDASGLLMAIGNLYNTLIVNEATWSEGSDVFDVISIDENN